MAKGAKVPLLDLQTQYSIIRDEVSSAIERVIESQYFIQGPEVMLLEQEIAQYSQCRIGVGLSSGTDALLTALMAVGIKSGDKVITTPHPFFATVSCIVRLGAKPVFVDTDPRTYKLDPARIEAALLPGQGQFCRCIFMATPALWMSSWILPSGIIWS